MDLLALSSLRGVFTSSDAKGRIYRKKRDRAIPLSVLVSDNLSFGFVGSDLLEETEYNVSTELLFPVQNLRFAIATLPTKQDRYESKVRNNEPLVIATSYPNTAQREMGKVGILTEFNERSVQQGGIEALPKEYPEVDAIFDLVRSGDTIRDNGLVIIEDDIRSVNLMLVTKGQL